MSILDRLLGVRSKNAEPDTFVQGLDELDILPMRRAHIRHIMPIEQQVYPRPWTERVFVDEIDQARLGNRHYIVGTINNQVVGYGGLLFIDSDAHVTNLAVHPLWRERGIATEILLDLSWHAHDRGCHALTLEVRHTNASAQNLYTQFGFVPAGVRKKYYENRDDAIVMWCTDVQEQEFVKRLSGIAKGRP